MIASENMVVKNFMNKIATKRSEKETRMILSESDQWAYKNDGCDLDIPVTENKRFGKNSLQKFVPGSSDDRKSNFADELKVKSSTRGSQKRGCPEVEVLGNENKRWKMDRCVSQQCSAILNELMTHSSGWAFNHPVDPVKLNIPEYFSIISKPMDLGKIKTKLEKNLYASVKEFEADVRLTFSNAILHNPFQSKVYYMAKELNNIFDKRWKSLEAKWNLQSINVEQGPMLSQRARNIHDSRLNCHKKASICINLLRKRMMSTEEKKRLRKYLVEVLRGEMSIQLLDSLKKFSFIGQKAEKIEADIDALDDKDMWELERAIRSSLDAKATKERPAKMSKSGRHQSSGKIFPKDIHLDGLSEQDSHQACRVNLDVKNISTSQLSKSDPYSNSDGWAPPIDDKLSMKKARRAALLKRRFAGIILKAERLLDHGHTTSLEKMQIEREVLERQQRKEKARIEAQIRPPESELKLQRQKDREAARLALQKIERAVDINDNLQILKDLERLCGCPLSYPLTKRGYVFESLSISLKRTVG